MPSEAVKAEIGILRLAEGVGTVNVSTIGLVLSTVNVVDGPAAVAMLPARSVAVPAAMKMPNVPLPVMPLRVTVRVRPVPVTFTVVASAVPVLFKVTSLKTSVLELKIASA